MLFITIKNVSNFPDATLFQATNTEYPLLSGDDTAPAPPSSSEKSTRLRLTNTFCLLSCIVLSSFQLTFNKMLLILLCLNFLRSRHLRESSSDLFGGGGNWNLKFGIQTWKSNAMHEEAIPGKNGWTSMLRCTLFGLKCTSEDQVRFYYFHAALVTFLMLYNPMFYSSQPSNLRTNLLLHPLGAMITGIERLLRLATFA